MAAKRKTLHDYFDHDRGSKKRAQAAVTKDATERTYTTPSGLGVIDNFVSPDEEAALLVYLDSLPWRTDLARRCMHFGGTYCLMPPRHATAEDKKRIESTVLNAPPMPPELGFVIDRMVDHKLYKASARPAYCIVNEYRSGQGISAHVENFRFGSPVCALTLAGADTMRFHELAGPDDGSVRSGKAAAAPRTGQRKEVQLRPRGLLVMRGEARERWQHEIARGRTMAPGWRRVSLTFRVDRER